MAEYKTVPDGKRYSIIGEGYKGVSESLSEEKQNLRRRGYICNNAPVGELNGN